VGAARRYGGQTADERRNERRARLVAAACAICGDNGWIAVTMRRVCARAGLTDRYFSESFADRDALLIAVFDETLAELSAEVLAAGSEAPPDREAQLRSAITTVVRFFGRDAGKARILLCQPGDDSTFERHRCDALQRAMTMMLQPFAPDEDDVGAQMTALFAAGGLTELFSSWVRGTLAVGADDLVEHGTRLALSVAEPHGPSSPRKPTATRAARLRARNTVHKEAG